MIVEGEGIGEMVHIVREGKCTAAIIIDNYGDGKLAVQVFPRPYYHQPESVIPMPGDPSYRAGAMYSQTRLVEGSWHWPERTVRQL